MKNRNVDNDRHAYMIMCHNNFDQLCRLLKLLDDARNDIYIHVDIKSRDVPYDRIKDSLKCARLFFVRRIDIVWGGFSYVRCYCILLKAATKTKHTYYHMLSGVDLPLKSQDEIHDFFRNNAGKEFITFDYRSNRNKKLLHRVKTYHFLQEIIGRKKGKLYDKLRILEKKLIRLQNRLGVDRSSGKMT